uniref:Uncharacterized protein n=1 Tax=Branchiostoma floridae TaxID=7739 RepID=C3YPS4_BRAFL|eukprot:XP_002601846.1 hypothetical protein BRAFLDRAFT_75937 [Branchiostoma floridae]
MWTKPEKNLCELLLHKLRRRAKLRPSHVAVEHATRGGAGLHSLGVRHKLKNPSPRPRNPDVVLSALLGRPEGLVGRVCGRLQILRGCATCSQVHINQKLCTFNHALHAGTYGTDPDKRSALRGPFRKASVKLLTTPSPKVVSGDFLPQTSSGPGLHTVRRTAWSEPVCRSGLYVTGGVILGGVPSWGGDRMRKYAKGIQESSLDRVNFSTLFFQ